MLHEFFQVMLRPESIIHKNWSAPIRRLNCSPARVTSLLYNLPAVRLGACLTTIYIGIDYTYTYFEQGQIMQAITTKLFRNGQSQAVRIPKPFQFVGIDEVMIRRQGNAVIITPKRKSWASFAEMDKADADFMVLRPEVIETTRVIF